jgi:hypothetical protein
METYKNLSGRSGVARYKIGDNDITVEFKNGSTYNYGMDDNDFNTITKMHALGNDGIFLNRYINSHQPNFTKLNGPTNKSPFNREALRAGDQKKVDKSHDRYMMDNKDRYVNVIKEALKKKEASFSQWKNQRQQFRR